MFKHIRSLIWFVAKELFPSRGKSEASQLGRRKKTVRTRGKKEPRIILSKRDIGVLAMFGLVIAGASSFTVWNITTGPARALADHRRAEMEQLRRDYHLSEPQFQQVKALRDDYLPKCDVMCKETEESHQALQRAMKQQLDATRIEALRHLYEARYEYCRKESLEHHAKLSRCMNPEDSSKYFAAMEALLIPDKERR